MPPDKYTATWVSHSSIGDFLKCPRAYYLKNVYKDSKTGHKVQIMKPPLALGQAVHEVLESLSVLPKDDRFKKSLPKLFEAEWEKVSGENGGFVSGDQEYKYKKRGLAMLNNVYHHPGPLKELAVKINQELPYYWLSEEDNIILCGKIDWLEYLKDEDSVHIIDFKTGRTKEDPDSLQLPIYYLLATNCQERQVAKASYWYIENDKQPKEKKLPDLDEAQEKVFKIAQEIKLARQLNKFECKEKGCSHCLPYEKILKGGGKFVGYDGMRDIYILDESDKMESGSQIL